MKFILLWIVFLPVIASAAATGKEFDCERFLIQTNSVEINIDDPIAATIAKFSGQVLEFEDVLAWTANLLGEDKDRFIEQVRKHLGGVFVIREKPGRIKSFLPEKDGVRYWRRTFAPESLTSLEFFLEAIRTVFSAEIGDGRQWNRATAQERLRLALQFKSRATRALLYEYKLYDSLKPMAPEANALELKREYDLPIPERRPFRIFAPSAGNSLFEEVRLTAELVSRIDRLPERSDGALQDAIERYVNENFVNLMNDYYSSKPGFIRISSLSVVVMAGTGAVFAYIGYAALPPTLDKKFEGLNPELGVASNARPQTPSEAMLRQLEDTSKDRALTEEEKIVFDALRRSSNSRITP